MRVSAQTARTCPMSTRPDQPRDTIERLREENERLRAELDLLRALSFEDPLTGLKNRRYFDERLAAEVDRATRHGAPVSVLVVDLDRFKQINDTHGHEAGDDALRWTARFLVACVREHDVVCRSGGDEFMVILPGATAEGARQLVDRIRRRLVSAGVVGDYGRVSLSLGAASWGPGCAAARDLVVAADDAMYDDKRRWHGAEARPSDWQ